MTPEERLERYADLVVRVGANVQEGQEAVSYTHLTLPTTERV